jgi:uncharacterized membrane protein
MTIGRCFAVYCVGAATALLLDLVWLGVVAQRFYQQQIGYLLRSDVRWVPAVLFYLIYIAALGVIVVWPAVERASVGRAVALGAFFGLAAYAAYDLTSLALIKDYPTVAALVDLVWGTSLSAVVSAVMYFAARAFLAPHGGA